MHKTEKVVKSRRKLSDTAGNVLITGVVVITLLSLFGVAMVTRMVLDANMAARRVTGTRAYYVADGLHRYLKQRMLTGRKWAFSETGQTFAGLEGTYDIELDLDQQYINGSALWDREATYTMTVVATVGPSTRAIEVVRYRNSNDMVLVCQREIVADEFD